MAGQATVAQVEALWMVRRKQPYRLIDEVLASLVGEVLADSVPVEQVTEVAV